MGYTTDISDPERFWLDVAVTEAQTFVADPLYYTEMLGMIDEDSGDNELLTRIP